jgi:hypothetical protein
MTALVTRSNGDKTFEVAYDAKSKGYRARQVDTVHVPQHSEPLKVNARKDNLIAVDDTVSTIAPVTAADGVVTVDIMTVYSPQARTNAGGAAYIETKIMNAVALANQAYLNSQVNMQLRSVYIGEVSYTETGNMADALSAITSTGDGKMDEVHQLRNQYGADEVVLIDADQNYCGIGYEMDSNWFSSAFAPYAFAVVHDDHTYGCMSTHTYTHELGHNMGNSHDHANAAAAGIKPYSWGYSVCGSFHTIMSYACSSGRISQFSSPNLMYNGVVTGVTDWADAARSLNDAALTIAAWRPSGTSVVNTTPSAPQNLTLVATAPTKVKLTWTDTSDNETGFRIERSLDGVNFATTTTIAANLGTYTDATVVASTTYTYRVYALNAEGSAVSNLATVTTPEPDTVVPSIPTNLMNGTVSNTQVPLTWVASSDNVAVTGYHVYRNGAILATVTGVSYTDTSVVADTTYSYTVRAIDGSGNVSGDSNTVIVTTPTVALTVTSSVAAKATSAIVTWNTNLPTTGTVWYGTAANTLNKSVSDISSVTSHDTTLTGLTKLKTYYYQVVATDTAGQTIMSPVNSFKTKNR